MSRSFQRVRAAAGRDDREGASATGVAAEAPVVGAAVSRAWAKIHE